MVSRQRNKKAEDSNGQEKMVKLTPEIICNILDDAIIEVASRQYFKRRRKKRMKICEVTEDELKLARWIVDQLLAERR